MSGQSAPGGLSGSRSDKLESSRSSIFVKHLDGLKRILLKVLAEQRHLCNQVRRRRDNMTAALFRLDDVQYFTRAGPKQLRLRQRPQDPDRLGHQRNGVNAGI